MWFRAQVAHSWQDIAALTRRVTADEAGLRHKIWRRLLREAASLPFAEDVMTAHYCIFDRHTPFYVKAVLVGAVLYFITPDDFLPIPSSLMGLADDAAVLGTAFKAVSSHIKPEHREAARYSIERMRREIA
jgi:uncharacterized membrane protein YkvA (DUF1232 family)